MFIRNNEKVWVGIRHLACKAIGHQNEFRFAKNIETTTLYLMVANFCALMVWSLHEGHMQIGAGHVAGLLMGGLAYHNSRRLNHSQCFAGIWSAVLLLALQVPFMVSLVASDFSTPWVIAVVFVLLVGSRSQFWVFNHLGFALSWVLAVAWVHAAGWSGQTSGVPVMTQENTDLLVKFLLVMVWLFELVGQYLLFEDKKAQRSLVQSAMRMMAHDLAAPVARAGILCEAIRARCQRCTTDGQGNNEVDVLVARLQRLMEGLGEQVSSQIGAAIDDLNTPEEDRRPIAEVVKTVRRTIEFQCAFHDVDTDVIEFNTESASAKVRCDQRLLGAMVSNLIDNAIRAVRRKSGDLRHGSVVVSVHLRQRMENADPVCRVIVIDRGDGMTQEQVAALNDVNPDQYVAVPHQSGETHGVGLRMSAAVLKRIGGGLICASEVGSGSTFEMVIPLA